MVVPVEMWKVGVMNVTTRTGRAQCTGIIRRLRLLGVVLTWVALVGCSAVRLAYNQAPELAYWALDDYADFNGAQSLQLKADLTQWQAWHRQTQLPAYAQTLQQLQQQVPGDITAQQVCSVAGEVRARLKMALDRAEPAASALAVTLQPAQLAAIARKFDKSNRQWRSDYLDADLQKVRDKRLEQATDRAEMVFGTLNSAQLETLQQAGAASGFDAATAYAERLRRQQDTLQTLRALTTAPAGNTSPSVAARPAMQALLQRLQRSPNPAYRRYQDALTQEGCSTVAALHQRATPAQRQKAVLVLHNYEQSFRVLAGPVASAP
jgi:hypothetical protein